MWQILPGQSLRHRTWDGESVLFNDLSGDTHLLDDDALAVLLALRDGPQDTAALLRRLAPDEDDAEEALLALLASLAAIHLVQPLAP